jgi:hypothetical protein
MLKEFQVFLNADIDAVYRNKVHGLVGGIATDINLDGEYRALVMLIRKQKFFEFRITGTAASISVPFSVNDEPIERTGFGRTIRTYHDKLFEALVLDKTINIQDKGLIQTDARNWPKHLK